MDRGHEGTSRPDGSSRRAAISVVIPTYNAARFVPQAIDSVLNQTVRPAEVVVIDDGSRDDTPRQVERFGDSVRYVFQQNAGVAAARNRGVKETGGEHVAFLDADDVWHPRKIELHLAAMASRPEFALMGTDTFSWPCEQMPPIDAGRCPEVFAVSWRSLVLRNLFTTSTVIVRRDAFERSGGFDPDLRGPEDRDLWWRIAEFAGVGKFPVSLTGYRRAEGTLGNQAATMDAGGYLRLRKMDERRVWKGDWLLRRKAYSHHCYACRNMYEAAADSRAALKCLVRSFAWYPLPYRSDEVKLSLERLRALYVTGRRAMRPRRTRVPARAAGTGSGSRASECGIAG